ncbi:MAG: transcription-repair coupling factor [Bacteroidetes bacterium]|nr:transcription-repair coupling factor [Bacteroidota bacterium]
MKAQELITFYQDSLLFQELSSHFLPFIENENNPHHLYLDGLIGSIPAILFSSLFLDSRFSNRNHLVILNDAEEAAYFFNSLESLTQSLNLFYFPSSFKTTKNFEELNSSHVVLRTEALVKTAAPGNKKILVTYPQALFEKVIIPGHLHTKLIFIKSNDTLALDELLERFVEFGFLRTDFVYEPGQFAMRGGILDIYSFGNEKPYRIELFGNEVDSIRIFDPETQLSERRLTQVSIIPQVEQLREDGEKISLLEFMPENTIFWIQDWSIISEKLSQEQQFLKEFLLNFQTKNKTDNPDDEQFLRNPQQKDFIGFEILEKELKEKQVIEFGYEAFFANQSIQFITASQPAFNRQFDLLIADLQNHLSKGYKLYIFAEQAKQLERLHSIFSDLQTDIAFNPIILSIHEGFIDHSLKILCYTDHQIFQRYHKYKIKQAFNKSKALTLKTLRELQPGDFVTHIDHGIGMFSGLQKLENNGKMQEAVRIIYKDGDILYVNINSLHKISKYTGKEGTAPKVYKLGSNAWQKIKEKTKTKVKELAFDLIKLYAKRKAQKGFAHTPDTYLQTELEASFLFEDTPDQYKATADVKKDMESTAPMDRLICGDVGFGKTEIAIRAAFKTCVDGKQAAVLVPTTILAFQHYKTFSERLAEFPVKVEYMNRFKSTAEKKEIVQKLASGKIDIIIGTHGLLGKNTQFKDLGIIIIDEEQKFGVGHKEKLKTIKASVDCLTLTATPIPRTLQFSLMGARDLSIINTPPPNRQPIHTELHVFNQEFIRDAIYFETERNGQVFFIHNRVMGLSEMAGILQNLCPDLSIGFAHGQLEGHILEQKIMDFINKKYDVLVCTNIIESGVDISNVNTIIINNAHHFGLSDLHQLRGRVGRSNRKAFCYLLSPPLSTLPADSRKRLQTLEQFSELGSGFQIAMRDLDIRGAGNMLGGEQSGFIADIGIEMYQKILDEAIRELKRSDFKELFKEEISKQDDFVTDCTIDTDLEILIPDDYVESITERLALYTQLDQCENEGALQIFKENIIDRFGPIPNEVEDLLITIRCRWLAVELGFEKMTLKNELLRCYFINKNDSPYFESELFKNILNFLQEGTNRGQLKQSGNNFILQVKNIQDMVAMHHFLKKMHHAVFEKEKPDQI